MYRLSALSRAAKPVFQRSVNIARPNTFRATSVATFHTSQKHFAKSTVAPEATDGFLQGGAANYIEEMYESWLKDPSSVHLSWQIYFKNMANGVSPTSAYTPPPNLVPSASARLPSLPGDSLAAAANASSKDVIEHMKIQLMVRAYQVRGHHIANLDPLGIQHADLQSTTPPELEYTYYGFTEKDLDRQFTLGPGILPALGNTDKTLTLREIVDSLKKIYCKYN